MSDEPKNRVEEGEPRKPEVNIVLAWIGRVVLKLIGWRIEGHVPNRPKMVVAAVFHTSNLDSVLMVLTAWATRTRLEWIVKDDWVKPPVIGHIIRALGGVPIDRSRSMNTVKQMANKFQQRDKLVLVIAPEGTRRKTNYWKTGFYWIAYEAGVPILLGLMDYGTRTIRLDRPLLIPSGDIEADMAQIWDALSGIQARYPERVSNMALRPSAKQRNQKLTTDVVSNQDTPPTEET